MPQCQILKQKAQSVKKINKTGLKFFVRVIVLNQIYWISELFESDTEFWLSILSFL